MGAPASAPDPAGAGRAGRCWARPGIRDRRNRPAWRRSPTGDRDARAPRSPVLPSAPGLRVAVVHEALRPKRDAVALRGGQHGWARLAAAVPARPPRPGTRAGPGAPGRSAGDRLARVPAPRNPGRRAGPSALPARALPG